MVLGWGEGAQPEQSSEREQEKGTDHRNLCGHSLGHVESYKGSGPNLTIRKRAPQLSSGQRLGQGEQLGVAKGYQGLRQDGAKAKEAPGLFSFLCFWPRLGWNPGPCLRGKC